MRRFRMILIGLLILAIGLVSWDIIFQEPKASVTEKDLVQEFSKIVHPIGVKQLSLSSSHKTHQAIVVAKYESTMSYNELLQYYKPELLKLGWEYKNEEVVTDWGKNLGGRIIRFT